ACACRRALRAAARARKRNLPTGAGRRSRRRRDLLSAARRSVSPYRRDRRAATDDARANRRELSPLARPAGGEAHPPSIVRGLAGFSPWRRGEFSRLATALAHNRAQAALARARARPRR